MQHPSRSIEERLLEAMTREADALDDLDDAHHRLEGWSSGSDELALLVDRVSSAISHVAVMRGERIAAVRLAVRRWGIVADESDLGAIVVQAPGSCAVELDMICARMRQSATNLRARIDRVGRSTVAVGAGGEDPAPTTRRHIQ